MKYIRIVVFFLITIQTVFAQQNNIVSEVFAALDQSDYDVANILMKGLNDSETKTTLNAHYELIKNGVWNKEAFQPTDTLSGAYNIHLLNVGIATYIKKGQHLDSYKILKKSLLLAKQRNDTALISQSFKFMLEIFLRFHSVIEEDKYLDIIEDARKHAFDSKQREIIDYFDFHLSVRFNHKDEHKYKVDSLYNIYIHKKTTNPFYKVRRSEALNSYHRKISNNVDSANFYMLQAKKEVLFIQKGVYEQERHKAISINEANTLTRSEEYDRALAILDTIKLSNEKEGLQFVSFPQYLLTKYVNYAKSYAYFGKKDSLHGLEFENLALKQEQKEKLIVTKISELEEKNENALKDKRIAEDELKRNNLQSMIIGLIGLLLFVILVALLTRTALKRKQELAKKEKELEVQKHEELLRKHEIQTVNAMIVGQEKERKRIANDLHDNINSDIITAKVQLEHLAENIHKVDNPQKILNLCVSILDDAYHKTRHISHERNSGVMAQKELIPGIKKLAEKASTAYGLKIFVHDHGFENKLSNSVEINIFSIIQELVTNILKHANATEATISLTQHDQELNIIIEDNGIGFDTKKELSTKGMGLSNLQEQLEQIHGMLTIDSVIGKGTTIVIDIKNNET
ncbi:sensor histidine kinase [Kordia sp.]|uniref:sensor histidine kinase n=1 Tax=Kordia sp. TaxID=1965332 RepID=UPI003B58C6A9